MTSNPGFGATTPATEVAQALGASIKGRTGIFIWFANIYSMTDWFSVLVTGVSPEGLGRTTVLSIASQSPALLILASRTLSNLETVKQEIRKKYPEASVHKVVLDLSSQKSIRTAAAEINQSVEHLDVLINNAGVNSRTRKQTAQGIELVFGVNHVGPFLLTKLLMPKLRAAAERPNIPKGSTRIINLTSQGHRLSPIRFSDYNFEKAAYEVPESEKPPPGLPDRLLKGEGGYLLFLAYGQSKTANILHAMSLTDALRGQGIISFSVHPGSMYSRQGTSVEGSDWQFHHADLL
jgi:NAD(P)-dependent dehydrogenase (short-subunit alcohol dehydrogenase family)